MAQRLKEFKKAWYFEIGFLIESHQLATQFSILELPSYAQNLNYAKRATRTTSGHYRISTEQGSS